MELTLSQKVGIFCLLLNIAITLTAFFLKTHLPPVIPLFYGLPVSSDELGSSFGIILPSLVTACLSGVNLILTKFIKDDFLQTVLVGLIIIITCLSTITIVKIMLLVGKF